MSISETPTFNRPDLPRWLFWPGMVVLIAGCVFWIFPKALVLNGINGLKLEWGIEKRGLKREFEGRKARIRGGW